MDFDEGIGLERNGATAILTLNNPGRRNAFFPEMRRKLTASIRALGLDPEVRAIVLTGADGHFCTGADLSRVAQRPRPASAMETRENMKEVLDLLRLITMGTKPMIAAVEGDAFGAGCSIAIACDVVVATPTSRFGTSFGKIGLVPDMGMLYTLVQRIGRPRAARMMMLATTASGAEAVTTGLADELAEPGGALEHAMKIARQYEAVAPMSVALIKSALGSTIASVEDVIRTELDLVPLATSSEDAKEGIAAFREKRRPQFQGR